MNNIDIKRANILLQTVDFSYNKVLLAINNSFIAKYK